VPPDTRDAVVDEVRHWSADSEVPLCRFIGWLGVTTSKFYQWLAHYGLAHEHNGKVPRDFWLEDWEKQAILAFHAQHPLEGYRRLAFMMLDADLVAASPSTVWRVLHAAGRLHRWGRGRSVKGTGFVPPGSPHEHWHVDIAYVNVSGTFFYLISVLDGYSRFIVHWELCRSMTEADVEIVLQRAQEFYPQAAPRIITDNGSQFIARDFKELIRLLGMTHVRTSPGYPQSNGKLERYHRSVKAEAIRVRTPLCEDDARQILAEYVQYYNTLRLHSGIGYVTPQDKLAGREGAIFALRDERLEAARQRRAARRAEANCCTPLGEVV